MLEIGRINNLEVISETDFGLYLDGKEDGEILLPLRYAPQDIQIGDFLDVFIYLDSNDRLIATTETPLAMLGDFAVLEVVAIERVGAFLDWGLSKDLFLPFAEQTRELKIGHKIIVFIYLDKSHRISASMRLDRNIEKTPASYQNGQPVRLLIAQKTDLGYKAIIEGGHWGMLFEDEVFQNLQYAQIIDAYIKNMRPDGKIDLTLRNPEKKSELIPDLSEHILTLLKTEGGFLALNDKTPAEKIYELFGVSKKKYKIALGGLYKKRLIKVDEDGIRIL
jgi:predicted RNA-binding protein (virulence factor B family)